MSDPDPRVILITGGSRGIGRAAVDRFQRAGWRVAACATSTASLASCPADLCFPCDVADAAAVRAGVEAVLARFGRITALLHSAGVAGGNPLDPGAPDDVWHRIIAVNLHGTYHVCKAVAPHLPDGAGRIITLGSVLSLRGVPDASAYCAAKHGALGFTRALAHALAPRRITVNAICPGWVRTDMGAARLRELGMTEASLQGSVPLGRFIEPDEVAALAEYLTTDAAAGITGQALTIDGGALA